MAIVDHGARGHRWAMLFGAERKYVRVLYKDTRTLFEEFSIDYACMAKDCTAAKTDRGAVVDTLAYFDGAEHGIFRFEVKNGAGRTIERM